ncbi:MAG: acyl-CoA dehydrogenase [Deltaproteobacteria bacterium]|nr:acyl-CoA dehydrogenase [Deltaproteobacteria bacterium]
MASDIFLLDDQHRMIRESAREFARREIAPKAKELDETGRYPKEIIEKLSEMGFMGVMVPEQYGGAGLDALSYAIAMEEVSAGCASTGVIMSVNNSLVCSPVVKFGDEAQKKRYLPPLASGKRLGCFALSEPGNGSDAAAMRTAARRDGDHYVLNGTKNFITNGREADVCIVFATTDAAKKHKGVTAFLVDKPTAGLTVGKLEDKLGINASSTAQLHFENVRVPEANRLGEEGAGFKIAMATLDGGRIGIASQALGIASAALEASKKFAREREAFGAPIAKLQAIQFHVADMATRLDAARLLTWRAAAKAATDERFTREAAMAKLFASEAAMWITTTAIQVHGGYGYTKEYPVERHFRDAKITEIYEGTSEIQRIVIGGSELAE